MGNVQNQIDLLIAFKDRDKFSTKAWNEKGLNPSSEEVSMRVSEVFNTCAKQLISAISKKSSDSELRSIILTNLKSIEKLDYDTEEREFVCDLFYELADFIKVSIKDDLYNWLYRFDKDVSLAITKHFKPQEIIETRTQPCTTCGIQLESQIMQIEEGISDMGWLIVKCLNCNECNLITPGNRIKEIKFGNYQLIETLSKVVYSLDQAKSRLEEIKISQIK